MRDPPMGCNLEPICPPVSYTYTVYIQGLRYDNRVRYPFSDSSDFGEVPYTCESSTLLIDSPRDLDRSSQSDTGSPDSLYGIHGCGDSRLHIGGPSTVYLSVFDDTGEGIDRPS